MQKGLDSPESEARKSTNSYCINIRSVDDPGDVSVYKLIKSFYSVMPGSNSRVGWRCTKQTAVLHIHSSEVTLPPTPRSMGRMQSTSLSCIFLKRLGVTQGNEDSFVTMHGFAYFASFWATTTFQSASLTLASWPSVPARLQLLVL